MLLSTRIGNVLRRSAVRLLAAPKGASLDESLFAARSVWMQIMWPHRNNLGKIDLPGTRPMLDSDKLKNCRVVADRSELLKLIPSNGRVAEVGVLAGSFSQAILDLNRPTELHLIDQDLRHFNIAARFSEQIAMKKVFLHEGPSHEMLSLFPDKFFDVIYIDADHSYEGVKRDIAAAKPRLSDAGYLIFNDYTYWSPIECMRYGVMDAVNELCIEDNWEAVFLALQAHMYNDIVLQRRADT